MSVDLTCREREKKKGVINRTKGVVIRGKSQHHTFLHHTATPILREGWEGVKKEWGKGVCVCTSSNCHARLAIVYSQLGHCDVNETVLL